MVEFELEVDEKTGKAVSVNGQGHCIMLQIKHFIAKQIYNFHDFPTKNPFYKCRIAIQNWIDRLPGELFRFAAKIDDKVICPNCGKSMPLIHLEKLKTYCFACSYWGHESSVEKENNDV